MDAEDAGRFAIGHSGQRCGNRWGDAAGAAAGTAEEVSHG
jgi:hypothetical protein